MLKNQVADVYGIRATLVDGGEIRGAGNLWICPEVRSLSTHSHTLLFKVWLLYVGHFTRNISVYTVLLSNSSVLYVSRCNLQQYSFL